ncbi:hypothetical protein TRFO_02339 [Tritrichomonas foetus]|uniref:TPR Domain containing protein n=1 Tax=Tritrichomonas foetus TaxID=1144522 RepID=A0A1J4J817_9EUKA|nr:hypothetical protein TRFO_02339 [Tritrichomonas foetus]|eukprot:OHS93819.1 hypothetical protein TRFO_02339 [Tritrichomonas foetus]
MSKAVKAETSDSFAVQYYSDNPVDTRTPQEKLDEVESKLGESNVDNDEKFSLLVQKRSLCQMIYGENSPESIRAATELGAFYNSLEKPESALRNLNKAHQSAKQVQLEEEDGFLLALELADASLNSKQGSKQERHKQIVLADNTLTPYAEHEGATPQIVFRKDLCFARIRAYRQKFEEAVNYYEKALSEYSASKENNEKKDDDEKKDDNEKKDDEEEEKEEDIIEPNLYVEAAQIAEKAESEKSEEWFKKAYDLYTQRGFEAEAKRIENKIPSEEGNEEEEEQGQGNGEEEEGQADQNDDTDSSEKKDDVKAEEEKAEEPAANEEEAPAAEEGN